MRIFVLGAGATGSLLAQLLERQGHTVWCGDRDLERARRFLGRRSTIPVAEVNARNLRGIVKAAKGCQVEYRTEKAGIIHAGVGKASFTEEALAANVRALVEALNRAKPSGAKGAYVQRISLSSTMGPGFKVEPASIGA